MPLHRLIPAGILTVVLALTAVSCTQTAADDHQAMAFRQEPQSGDDVLDAIGAHEHAPDRISPAMQILDQEMAVALVDTPVQQLVTDHQQGDGGGSVQIPIHCRPQRNSTMASRV